MFLNNYYKWKKIMQDLTITRASTWYDDLGLTTTIKSTNNADVKIFNKFVIYNSQGDIQNTVLDRNINGINNNAKLLFSPEVMFSSDNNEPLESDYVVSNIIQNLTISNLNYTATPSGKSLKTIITFTVTNNNTDSVELNKYGVTRLLRSAASGGEIYNSNYVNSTVLIAEGFLNSPITLAPSASGSVYIELNEENS